MNLVNVIDSIVITKENSTSTVLAKWVEFDASISVFGELISGNAIKLFLEWSDKDGAIDLHTGDYFTFLVPEVFRQESVSDITDAVITTPSGVVIATYSISSNSDNKKEVRVTFTDFVETQVNIWGNLWLLLFVGSVDSDQQKTIDFVINGELVASGNIMVRSSPNDCIPIDKKNGFSVLGDVYDGYYIFNWSIDFNMEEDVVNGFHVIENFSFEDIIPEDSPHVFLTDEIRNQLNIIPSQFPRRVGEYKRADGYAPEDRYSLLVSQMNGTGDDFWYHTYVPLVDGSSTVGIDGGDGLNVSDIVFTEKLFSANLGRLTRPTRIQYCTVATIKLNERALGDSEVVSLIKNEFFASHGEDLPANLNLYRFESGGQGFTGDCNFSFTKVNETDDVLSGAEFCLYATDDFSLGANRIAYSDANGIVTFNNLPEGTFYFLETNAPYGYITDNTVYKVVLDSIGYEIYYGENFQYALSNRNNRIENQPEFVFQPVSVTFIGIKNFTGQALLDGMFDFIVKDSGNEIVADGTNDANGNIIFSEISFDSTGTFIFTVEEVIGSYSAITYDSSSYTIIVTVTDDGENLSAQITYPNGGIIFNNSYTAEPVSVTLEGLKSFTGQTMLDGMFNFIVKDSEGITVATGINDTDGNIIFSEIEFNNTGIYTYTVQEVAGSQIGITYDSSIFTVIVTVTDNFSGTLIAQITYPDSGIIFNNITYFSDNPVSIILNGTKNLIGKSLESGMFNFVVKDNIGDIVATGTNAADGRITFSEILIHLPGEYIFTVEEIAGSNRAITYDNTKYTVTLTVIDDGNGNPILETPYPDENFIFNNSYSSTAKPCQCYSRSTKCRISIEGKKIWIDNNNEGNTRPAYAEITLLRDGEVYKIFNVDSTSDGSFLFCCVPIGKNSRHKYEYTIDELSVPNGYTKKIEGYNVINTLI